jgi:hypothetical protein
MNIVPSLAQVIPTTWNCGSVTTVSATNVGSTNVWACAGSDNKPGASSTAASQHLSPAGSGRSITVAASVFRHSAP